MYFDPQDKNTFILGRGRRQQENSKQPPNSSKLDDLAETVDEFYDDFETHSKKSISLLEKILSFFLPKSVSSLPYLTKTDDEDFEYKYPYRK